MHGEPRDINVHKNEPKDYKDMQNALEKLKTQDVSNTLKRLDLFSGNPSKVAHSSSNSPTKT